MDDRKKPQASRWFKQLETSSVGIEIGLSVAGGGFVGYLLDLWLGTSPWMLFFWFFCGVAAGFRAMLRVLNQLKTPKQPPDDITP